MMEKITQKQIGALVVATGKAMIDGRIKPATSAEHAVRNIEATINQMVADGTPREEAAEIMLAVDIRIKLAAKLDQTKEVAT